MPHTVFWELGAFVATFLYASYFEWFFHRYLFHSPRYVYRTFREHTLVHHQIYKGDESYHAHDDHPHKVTMDWWALVLFLGFHAPFFYLIQRVSHWPVFWGALAAIAVYYAIYETFHYVMHVPRAAQWLSRFRAFRFLDAHHQVHHKYMLSNLNVILPLADLTLGTLRDGHGRKVRLSGKLSPKGKENAGSVFEAESDSGRAGIDDGGARAAGR